MEKFLIKLVANGLIVVPYLIWFTEARLLGAVMTAAALSILAYVIGDQMILRATNNMVATVADFGLAFAVLWSAAVLFNWTVTFAQLATVSLLLAVVEWVFHMYLGRTRTAA